MKDNYIATAKAIGIILMVVGHAISQNFAYRFIYMFHMPLFFFCSGYFYKVPTSLEGVGLFVQKRIKGLYFPFVKWGILFLIFHNLFCDWHLYNILDTNYYTIPDHLNRFRSLLLTMTGQEQLLDPFWFLKELILSSMLICVLTYVLRKYDFKYKDIVVWLLFIFLTVITKYYRFGLPIIWDVSIMFLSATFVFAGYMYRKVERNSFYSYKSLILCFGTLLLFVWVRNDYLDMLWYNSFNVLLYIPFALIGIFMIFAFSRLIERYSVKRFFYYLGNHTMIILVLHLLVFKIGNLTKIIIYGFPIEKLSDFKIIQEYNDYFWIIYTLIGIIIPLVYNIIWERIKYCFSK